MEEDNFYESFKKSSETDRDFDFKHSSWYKINSLLDTDDKIKRRKWLLFLPWVLASAMLGFCLFLFKNQKETSHEIKKIIAQNNYSKLFKYDTITKYIFIHDTIIKNRIIYVNGLPQSEKSIENEVGITIPSDINASPQIYDNVDIKKTAENLANKFDENINTMDTLIEGRINEKSTVSKKPLVSKLQEKDTLQIEDKLVEKSNSIPQKQENTTDLKRQNPLNKIEIEEETTQTKVKLAKQKYKLNSEFGPYVGFLIPANNKVTKQYGYNLGLSYALNIAPNLQIQLKGAYSRLHFESNQFNEAIGIPLKESPNKAAGYVLENANSSLPSYNIELGLGYVFASKTGIKPIISLAYGTRYLKPTMLNYTFISTNKDDIVVEAENKPKQFVWNNIIPSFGLKTNNKNKFNWYVNGFYNYNNKAKNSAAPSYFGINSSLFYSF